MYSPKILKLKIYLFDSADVSSNPHVFNTFTNCWIIFLVILSMCVHTKTNCQLKLHNINQHWNSSTKNTSCNVLIILHSDFIPQVFIGFPVVRV